MSSKYRDEDFKLCFIKGEWAYFTTQDVMEQWADDWNDAPYEYNAGSPYEWQEYMLEKNGIEPYELRNVVFYGPFKQPSDGFFSSPYCVQDINKGAVPWLTTESWVQHPFKIMAGTTYPEFIRLIKLAGGAIYTEV